MYGIALSVAACLRAGTRADVAWNLDPRATSRHDPNDAVALTPGGGRLGGLLGGALDSRLIEEATALGESARVITVKVQPHEAAMIGIEPGTELRLALAPAASLPEELWERLLGRERVALSIDVDEGIVTASRVLPAESSDTSVVIGDDTITTTWSPRPTLVVLGGGPMAQAVAQAGGFVGWNVELSGSVEAAVALATSLSPIDGLVVTGHDTEGVGRTLQAALGSTVGYVGSIGPAAMQEARADWLAYRGVTDLDRISAPAGMQIGASSPEEVAIAVVAEMIAELNARSSA